MRYHWFFNRIDSTPSTFHTCMVSLRFYFKLIKPVDKILFFTIYLYNAISSCIVTIFRTSCPFAIRRRIAKIIVNPFYCKFWGWSFTHIGQKITKIVPTVANLYTPSSIIAEAFGIWVITSRTHTSPNSVFYGFVFTMFRKCFYSNFVVKAFTALGMSIVEMLNKYRFFIAAIAFAKPIIPTMGFMRNSLHNKSAISFAGNVF